MKIRLIHPAIGEFAFPVLTGRVVVIGRSGTDVDVELNWDCRVSRRHAELTVVNGVLWVRDLGSRNGTWQGAEQLLSATPIHPGCTFSVGDTIIAVPDHETIDLLFDEETSPLEHLPGLDREDAYQATADLRQHTHDIDVKPHRPSRVESPSTPPRPPPMGAAAIEPRLPRGRFDAEGRLEVPVSSPAALKALWRDHLSRGGLFVEVAETRAVYQRIEVLLSAQGGAVGFDAIVVHASEPNRARALGVPAGLGLQIGELPAAVRGAIAAYSEGLSSTLAVSRSPSKALRASAPPQLSSSSSGAGLPTRGRTRDLPTRAAEPPEPQSSLDAAVQLARALLDRLDRSDAYTALELSPEAPTAAILERIGALASALAAAAKGAPPAKATRLESALLALGRLQFNLGDPLRRLEHDFAHGHVRADARLAAARSGSGPSVTELRNVWQLVFPDRADKAAYLTRKAFTARQKDDLESAIDAARAALVENPFFDELRPTLANWERIQSGATEPSRPRSRPPTRRP